MEEIFILENSRAKLPKYYTNAATWTYESESFLLSGSSYEFEDSYDFFRTVSRQRSSPFWVQLQLTLSPEVQLYPEFSTNVDEESGEELNEHIAFDSEIDEESLEEDTLFEIDEEQEETCDAPGYVDKMNRLMNHLTEQYSIGITKFAEGFIRQNASNLTLYEKIEQRNREHTRAPTWGGRRKSSTVYYQ